MIAILIIQEERFGIDNSMQRINHVQLISQDALGTKQQELPVDKMCGVWIARFYLINDLEKKGMRLISTESRVATDSNCTDYLHFFRIRERTKNKK
jgi:hypothetical protein